MQTSSFRAPEHASEFLSKVSARCEKLLKAGIWDFDMSRLRGWINNFRSNEEQYLCAHLLDSLMYRSDRMANSLCRHAVHSVLPNSLASYPQNIDTWRSALVRAKGVGTVFVAVEGIKNGEEQPAKSGHLVLRQYSTSGAVNKTHFVHALHLSKRIQSSNVERVVYVDDFCGTGKQFHDFYSHFDLASIPPGVQQYYIPFACHARALSETFTNDITAVTVRPVELLSENSGFFAEKNGTFRGDNTNSVPSAKQFYLDMLESRGIKLSEPFGYGSLELAYGFKLSTPNNTLPIFWTNKAGWRPLLTR